MNGSAINDNIRELNSAIKNGGIFDASDEKLKNWLYSICSHETDTKLTAGDINKGLVVNMILMERRGRRAHRLIVFLAMIGILVGIGQLWMGWRQMGNVDPKNNPVRNLNDNGNNQHKIEPINGVRPIVPEPVSNQLPKK